MSQPSVCQYSDIKAVIALGSNTSSRFGTTLNTISAAIARLKMGPLHLIASSQFYSTPCVPAGAGPDYVNAAVAIQTRLSAFALLSFLHETEADFDRERTNRWASRTLDLDLIDYGGTIAPTRQIHDHWRDLPFDRQKTDTPDQLLLPHPRVQDRAFVLQPILDVAPDWKHPILNKTVTEMLAALPKADIDAISVIPSPLQTPKDMGR